MLIRQHTSFEKFYYPLTDTVALFTAPCALVILYTHVRAHCYNNMRSTEYVIIIYYNTYIIYIAYGSCMKNYIFTNDDSAGTRPCVLLNCAENMFSFKLPHNINRVTPIYTFCQ